MRRGANDAQAGPDNAQGLQVDSCLFLYLSNYFIVFIIRRRPSAGFPTPIPPPPVRLTSQGPRAKVQPYRRAHWPTTSMPPNPAPSWGLFPYFSTIRASLQGPGKNRTPDGLH